MPTTDSQNEERGDQEDLRASGVAPGSSAVEVAAPSAQRGDRPKTDRLQEAHDRLTDAVEQIVTGDDWQRMLQTASKFHKYSFNNQLLIFCQRPDATHVAGFNRWKSLGRLVRKGERGIQILAPVKYSVPSSDGPSAASSDGKIETEDKVTVLRGFRIVHVFDISQTDGEDLELDLVRPEMLDGEAPEGLWDALVVQATTAGFEVVRKERGSANGYCDFVAKEIGVDPDLPDLQAVKTLVHELAHARLHEGGAESREVAEIEVESVAFIVLDALGLASDTYSFPYVARWSKGELDLIKASAERAVSCASIILEGLDVATEVATPEVHSGSGRTTRSRSGLGTPPLVE